MLDNIQWEHLLPSQGGYKEYKPWVKEGQTCPGTTFCCCHPGREAGGQQQMTHPKTAMTKARWLSPHSCTVWQRQQLVPQSQTMPRPIQSAKNLFSLSSAEQAVVKWGNSLWGQPSALLLLLGKGLCKAPQHKPCKVYMRRPP